MFIFPKRLSQGWPLTGLPYLSGHRQRLGNGIGWHHVLWHAATRTQITFVAAFLLKTCHPKTIKQTQTYQQSTKWNVKGIKETELRGSERKEGNKRDLTGTTLDWRGSSYKPEYQDNWQILNIDCELDNKINLVLNFLIPEPGAGGSGL
jgi:hypothetical protein